MPATFPTLHHEEVNALFEHGLRIPIAKVHTVLALPKETVLADLRNVLRYAADVHPQLVEEWGDEELGWERTSFALHAVFMLGELPGRGSLDALLEFLAQPEDVLEFYLSDLLTEDVWEPICKLAPGHFDALQAFIRLPGTYTYARSIVGEAMRQLHFNRPDLHAEVEQWFAAQLDFFHDLDRDDAAMDFAVLSLLVSDVLDMHLTQFLSRIEALYAKEYVDPFDCGTIEKIRAELSRPKGAAFERPMLSIEARYAEFAALEERLEREDEARAVDEDAPLVRVPQLPPVRSAPKVGRNDPCPCGSGKKYKKCCLVG